MDYLSIIMPILAIIGMVVVGVVTYRRGKLNGRIEKQQTDNKKQREAFQKDILSKQKDILSKDQQIQTLQAQIHNLCNIEKSHIKGIESLKDKLRQKGREISLLSEASLFLTTGDFQQTCDLAAYRAGILPHVKFARLYMLNDEGTMLRLVSGYNISEKYLDMIKEKFDLSVNNIPAGVAVMNRVPFVVDDVSRDDYFAQWREITTLYDYRSYIAVPLLRTHRILGVIEIFFDKENVLTKDSLDIINIIANIAALAIENCLFIGKVQELSIIDELTLAYNHRFLINTFDKEIDRAVRHQKFLSYIMIDLDNFKTINDILGHLKGDEVLKSVSGIMKKTMRATDYVCRFGGDEFAIILPETNREDTIRVIEKMRDAVMPLWKSLPYGIDMSVGFSVYPEDGSTSTDLIKHADNLVYEEKRKKKAR